MTSIISNLFLIIYLYWQPFLSMSTNLLNECPDHCLCSLPEDNNTGIRSLTCKVFPITVPVSSVYLTIKASVNILTKEQLSPFNHLKYLSLQDSDVQEIENDAFINQKNLEVLNLSKNKLTRISNDTFRHCSTLLELNLEMNYIKSIHDDAFRVLLNLQKLDISDNHLQKIPDKLPKTLVELDTSNNFISELPMTVPLNYLRHLDLCGNNFREFRKINFPAPKLGSLCLGDQVDLVDPGALQPDTMTIFEIKSKLISTDDLVEILTTLPKLRSLKISEMTLQSMKQDERFTLEDLKTLTVNRVSLEGTIEQSLLFGTMSSLETLHIEKSPQIALMVLSSNFTLQEISLLKVLRLIDTQTTTLPSQLPSLLPKLKKLSLSSNPLHCDSDLCWISQRIEENLLVLEHPEQIQCNSPAKYRNVQLLSKYVTRDLCAPRRNSSNSSIPGTGRPHSPEKSNEGSPSNLKTMSYFLYAVVGLTILVVILFIVVIVILCKSKCYRRHKSPRVVYRSKNSVDLIPSREDSFDDEFTTHIVVRDEAKHDDRPYSTTSFKPKHYKKQNRI